MAGGLAFLSAVDPLVGAGVFVATALTDAVYVLFNAAVVSRRRLAAANWSCLWYLLSAFAVISFTEQAVYVLFAAGGSWVGAFLSVSFLVRRGSRGGPAAHPD